MSLSALLTEHCPSGVGETVSSIFEALQLVMSARAIGLGIQVLHMQSFFYSLSKQVAYQNSSECMSVSHSSYLEFPTKPFTEEKENTFERCGRCIIFDLLLTMNNETSLYL